jgi:hypothetical protein
VKYHCRKHGWVIPIEEPNGDRFCKCGYFLCNVFDNGGTCKDLLIDMFKRFPDRRDWSCQRLAVVLGFSSCHVWVKLRELKDESAKRGGRNIRKSVGDTGAKRKKKPVAR